MTVPVVLRITLGTAFAISLASCAAQTTSPGMSPRSAADRSLCFVDRDVENWESVNARTVLLHVRGARTYALDVFNDCSDIDWTQTIGLTNEGRRMICPGDSPTLIVPSRSRLGSPECRAISVKAMTPAEVDALKNPKG